MPCMSRIATKLRDLAAIESACNLLGISANIHSPLSITLRTATAQVRLTRRSANENFVADPAYARGQFYDHILQPLTMEYGKAVVKQWAKKNGYTVSAGEPGEYVLTQYR